MDAFYAAWVEDIVQQAVESLAADYCRKGQVDYVRVLYGRLCQGMTIAKAAEALKISPAAVDHYFRHARERLSEKLEQLVRRQVQCYCPAEEAQQEFAAEWQRLGQYLAEHGGIEEAVRRAYDLLNPVQAKQRGEVGLTKAVTRLTSVIRSSADATPSRTRLSIVALILRRRAPAPALCNLAWLGRKISKIIWSPAANIGRLLH